MKAIKGLALVGAATGLLAAGAGAAAADSDVIGKAVGSPGVDSGNLYQTVTTTQTNACGNTTSSGASILNPAFGNSCANR
jgi:ChpA-C